MKARLRIFHRLILRALFREPLRTALTVFAVALGVAVVLAIELAGVAAAGSFRSSLETLAGDADLEITAIGGVPEELLGTLARLPYPLEFSPRLEGVARVEPEGASVTAVGLDLIAQRALGDAQHPSPEEIADSRAVWIGADIEPRKGGVLSLSVNDRRFEFIVRGSLPGAARERVVVMDIASAQDAFARAGRLDRIEARHPPSRPLEHWRQLILDALPPGVAVEPAGARTDENRKMLAAFRWNLRVLSYISLIVCGFLIYNTISVSVVRRRPEIGIARALGATRWDILAAFLAEAACFGAAGGLAGLALGRLLAEGAVGMQAATVDSLYVSSAPAAIELSAGAVALALLTGVAVSLLSALAPAFEASRVAPVEALTSGQREFQARVRVRRDLLAGLLLAVLAAAASQAPPIGRKPVFGYVAALLLIAASAMATPAVVTVLSRAWRKGIRLILGVEAMLAARGLAASLRRTSVLVGALSTAVAMMVAVGIMVGSFRQTVVLWLDQQLRADLYLRPAAGGAGRQAVIHPGLADALEALPGVAAVERFRSYDISYGGLPALLASGPTEIVRRFGKTRFLPGQDRHAILDQLPLGDYVIVSEPFANKHRVRPDDMIALPLDGEPREFKALGVYYDYSNERGYIVMDRGVMLKYLPDAAATSLSVYFDSGADPAVVRRAVERTSADYAVSIQSNRALRAEAMRIFDRTFAITYALEAVAVFVAVMGIAGALLALIIDRRQEMGVLRFLGAATGQIRRLVLFEAALLGLAANLIGLAQGALLSLILIFVINKQSFGWTIQFHWPVALLAGGLSLIYAATLAAALYPARVAVRLNPIEAVREQ
ncbi:MAG: ABC transporter permease [Bryobacteraceae bacterium]|nr:ABC transporter permease [Bryobacteraceae bacterium]